MSDDDSLPALLDRIEAEQVRLRRILRRLDPAAIAARPATGQWSILENVRHLLFAEQLHLGGFLPGGRSWSAVGFTPQTMREARKLPPIDTAALPGIQDVLVAWDAIHSATRRELATRGTDEVRQALSGNLRHLRAHISAIERLARTAPPVVPGRDRG